jgi:peptidoglycan/LPS O-acetylase OafA/YrhL
VPVVAVPRRAGTARKPATRAKSSLGYAPSLDGVRAFAVLAVMAFHSGLRLLPGGFLGVDAFFVLSGFLITTLLVIEWQRAKTVRLRAFWTRRARRLLPALLVVVVFVVLYATLVAPEGTYPDLRSDALATLFYVANWHFIAVGGNYFVQAGALSLLTHTWSLAVEEQFYILWPLLLLGVLRLFRRLGPLLAVAIVGAVASAVEMVVLYRNGADLTRLYYGTDTHAQSLLIGVALAVALAMCADRRDIGAEPGRSWGWSPTTRNARATVAVVGVVGLFLDAALWWRVSYDSPFLWQGGFLLADIGTAAVLLSAVSLPRGALARGLSTIPLRFVGQISYGMYLWHFPLFQWVDQARTGLSGWPLFVVRLAMTLVVASASFYAVEQPIRSGSLMRHWRAWIGTPLAVGGVATFVVIATTGAGIASSALPTTVSAKTGSSATNGRVVMVVGDSTALTLGIDLTFAAGAHGATVVDKGTLGCGVAEVTQVATQSEAQPALTAAACNPASPASEQWPALWERWVAEYRPSVVAILAGRWEVSDVLWHGRWTSIDQLGFARYVRRQLERAVKIAASRGGHVDLLTAPCYSAAAATSTGPGPSDSSHRLAVYNDIVREVAIANTSKASLVNLDGLVCPGGHYRQVIDGVTVRAPDGVHFPFFSMSDPNSAAPDSLAEARSFGRWLGKTLWPKLLETR